MFKASVSPVSRFVRTTLILPTVIAVQSVPRSPENVMILNFCSTSAWTSKPQKSLPGSTVVNGSEIRTWKGGSAEADGATNTRSAAVQVSAATARRISAPFGSGSL